MAMYKKPISVPVEQGSGYPQTDIGKAGVWVKGKFPAGTPMKQYETMRGAGAATKGTKFLNNKD